MPKQYRADVKDEIDAELKWVEDNLPAATDAALLPRDGESSVSTRAPEVGTYKDKRLDQRSWLSSQPPWVQCTIAFAIFIIGLNFLMWLGGLHEQDDPALRGNYRLVHGGLETDEQLAEEANLVNP
eukprot:m.451312 g.451312  ORF g.451312 m.451312 type:complete len:126 (+) comp20132_c0_seq1:153-530(+)